MRKQKPKDKNQTLLRLSHDEYLEGYRSDVGKPEICIALEESGAHACKVPLVIVMEQPGTITLENGRETNSVERLGRYLLNLERGSHPTERALLPYKGLKTQAIEEWKAQLDKSLSSQKEILSFEQSFYGKVGPQGQVDGLNEDSSVATVDRYYEVPEHDYEIDYELIDQMKDFASSLGAELVQQYGAVTPISVENVLERIAAKGMDTRTGVTVYDKKNSPPAILSAVRVVQLIEQSIEETGDCRYGEFILGLRNQKLGLRGIFQEPFSDTLIGGRFHIPLLEYLRGTGKPEFLGWTDKFTGVGKAYNAFRKENSTQWPKSFHFMSDFSKMDTTVRSGVVELSLTFINALFPDLTPAARDLLNWSIRTLYKAPLRVSEDWTIVSDDHGAFSGSTWIQMVETVLQYIKYQFVLRKTREVASGGTKLTLSRPLCEKPHFLNLIGDDARLTIFPVNSGGTKVPAEIRFVLAGITLVDTPENRAVVSNFVTMGNKIHCSLIGSLAEVWTRFCSLFRMKVSLEKQDMSFGASNFCKHLTRTRSPARLIANDMDANEIGSYRLEAIYPTILALNSILYPEKLANDWTGEQDFGRIVQILDGCCDHPLFTNLIELVAKGHSTDLFRRPARYLPMMSLEEFDGVLYRMQKVMDGTHPRQYTWYTVDGYQKVYFKTSPTVTYLRTKLQDWTEKHAEKLVTQAPKAEEDELLKLIMEDLSK